MSNRLTFSLASLIVLLAFGLVFAPMSVMAHEVTDDNETDTTATPPTNPEHTGLSVGNTHNAHPKPTIRLKQVPGIARGDRVVITADDTDTDDVNESQFTLIIDYGQPIAGTSGELVADRANNAVTIGTGDFSGLIFAADGTSIASGAFSDLTIAATAVMEDDESTTTVDETLSQFEVLVTVPETAFPDGMNPDDTENDALDEVEIRIQLGSVATAFSLATLPANAITQTPGGRSVASDVYTLTLVPMLDTVPVTATPAATMVNGSTDIMVTLTATPPAMVPSNLMASDFSVMEDSTALELDDDAWDGDTNTLTITPAGSGDTTVTVAAAAVEEGSTAKISFTQVSVEVDRTAPMVTIGSSMPAAPMVGDEVTVEVSIDGTVDSSTSIAARNISVLQTPTSGTATGLANTYNAGVVTFMPTAAGTVTVTVNAGAVTDDVGNSSAVATKDITVTAPDAPVAVMAMEAADPVNGSTPIVVTLSATAPAMVPSDLMASDFSVMEGTTALTLEDDAWDGTANTLTITPAGSGNTTVTVGPSTAGMAKISFTQVSVTVDRTGPTVSVGTPTPAAPMANEEVMVTVSVADDATQGAVALEHITVTHTATDGTQSDLVDRKYNVNTKQVTFMPTAAGTVTVTVAAGAVMDAVGNSNAEASGTAITVAPAREAVAVMAMAAAATVNGSTAIEVTLSATAPAMVPSDLMADDFSVMEGDTALTPVVGDKDDASGTVKLTITPAGTGDTTVTVAPSEDTDKISFDQVSVEVDRTGPMVAFSGGTGAKANAAVTVTIEVTGAATGETLAVGDISVLQTPTDGTAKVLAHIYNAGVVTFTPDAASMVTVTVDADAVMDAVGNGNAETSTDPAINVAEADAPPDETAPTVMVTAGTQDGRTLPVTFTVADETALGTGTDATLDVTTDATTTEITVTGGMLGDLTATTGKTGEYTADITIDYDVTTVTVAVAAGAVKDSSDNSSAAVSMDFTVTATSAPPAELADGTFKIPAKSYIIIAHDEMSAGLPASITPMEWEAMPDLEALLFGGGTLLLTTDKATTLDRDGKADTDAEAAKKRDALITEVMAAVNNAKKGQASYTGRQWIELYNNLPVEITVTLSAKAGYPVPDADSATEIRLDRLSNLVGEGWTFEGLGQNGYDAGVPETKVDFVSFYRKERGGDKDGHVKGHWATSTETYLAGHKGTPGAAERKPATIVKKTELTVGPVIFNEISNRESIDHEWIELRNKSDAEQNMKNRRISIVTAVKSDVTVFDFGDTDAKIPAKGVLLLPFTDPSGDPNHPLAAGWNIDKNAANQVNGVGAHSPRYLVLKDAGNRVLNEDFDTANEGLPNDGEFVLILRTRAHGDDVGKDTNIWDIAGYSTKLKVDAATAAFTNLWPLKGNVNEAKITRNKLEKGKVHRRQHENVWGTWSDNGKDDHDDRGTFRDIGWTGVGYKRNASAGAENGGTPGYNHSASQSAGADATGAVIISEVMYNPSRNLPQWIELQNMSNTVGVNVDGWRLFVANHALNADGTDYEGADLSYNIDIKGRIPPGQTYLIASNGSRHNTQLPDGRIHNLRKGRGAKLLNPNGFYLTLKANAGGSE